MGKDFIDIAVDALYEALGGEKLKGRYGEYLTERELRFTKLLGKKGKILRNAYIPKDNGEFSEIDVLYITQKGIFVLESKNYSGWIFGSEKNQYWTVMLSNQEKEKLYNPIKQNKTHIKWLGKYVGEDIPLFSIIVFSERCELKKIEVESTDVKVVKRDRTYAAIRDIWNEKPDVLDETQVEVLYEKLKKLTNADANKKQQHIDTINQKYHNEIKNEEDVSEKAEVQPSSDMICPRCGNELVLRTAKKGENAGKQFYGCSAFPKCRYIRELFEEMDRYSQQ